MGSKPLDFLLLKCATMCFRQLVLSGTLSISIKSILKKDKMRRSLVVQRVKSHVLSQQPLCSEGRTAGQSEEHGGPSESSLKVQSWEGPRSVLQAKPRRKALGPRAPLLLAPWPGLHGSPLSISPAAFWGSRWPGTHLCPLRPCGVQGEGPRGWSQETSCSPWALLGKSCGPRSRGCVPSLQAVNRKALI